MMETCPSMISGVQMIKPIMIITRMLVMTSPTTDQHQEARKQDHAVAPAPVHPVQEVEVGKRDHGAEVRRSHQEDQDLLQLHPHPAVPDQGVEENVTMEKVAVQNHDQNPAAKSGHVHLPVVAKNGLGARVLHQVRAAAEVDHHLGIGQERSAKQTSTRTHILNTTPLLQP